MTTQTINRDSFIFYRSFFIATKCLKNEEKAQLFDAICSYALDGEINDLDGVAFGMFQLIKPQLDANRKRFENGCVKKQKISKTEAKPKQKISKTEANVNVNENVNENVNVNNNLNKKPNKEIHVGFENDFEELWRHYTPVDVNVNNNLNKKPNKEIHVVFENDFEELWRHYTPVVGRDGTFTAKGCKQTALNSYKKARAKFSHQKIMDCLELYLQECQKNNRFTKNVATWLNQAMQDGFETHEVVLVNAEPPKPAFLTRQQQIDLEREEQHERLAKLYSNQ